MLKVNDLLHMLAGVSTEVYEGWVRRRDAGCGVLVASWESMRYLVKGGEVIGDAQLTCSPENSPCHS
jgi:hypothetical protein